MTDRVRLSVAAARALSGRAMRGVGFELEDARILADHALDAALCGYEYSGLPKLLNVVEHPRFKVGPDPLVIDLGTSAFMGTDLQFRQRLGIPLFPASAPIASALASRARASRSTGASWTL